MAYSVIDKVYTIFIDVMTGSSNGYGKPTFYNTDSHTSFIELTVTNGSKEFNMTEFSYMFTVEKPDGTKYTNEYTTQDKSKLVIPVDAQMISCTGNCNAQLYVNKVVDGVNKTLTMVEFNYTVYKGLHEGLISESVDFDNVYVKILNKLDYIINNGADLTGDQAAQLAYAYQHSKSPHAPANIVETMHTEIGEAIDAHHKKVALSASQVGSYEGTDITIKPSNEGLTKDIVIKGRTLQNLFYGTSRKYTIDKNISSTRVFSFNTRGMLQVGKRYTIIINITKLEAANNGLSVYIWNNQTVESQYDIFSGKTKGVLTATFVPRVLADKIGIYLENTDFNNGGIAEFEDIMILEGDYTTPDACIPPYFEGIKSVGEPTPEGGTKVVYGSCGRNLMKTNTFEVQATDGSDTYVVLDKIIEKNIEVDPRKSYRLSGISNKEGVQVIALGCNTPIPSTIINHNGAYSFCVGNGGIQAGKDVVISGYKYITITTGGSTFIGQVQVGETVVFSELQLEEGTEATAYEPYQEDIKEITVNLDGGLEGLPNGVHNYLYSNKAYSNNLYLAQVVGSYTITGDEAWIQYSSDEGFDCVGFYYLLPSSLEVKDKSNFMCNNFKGTTSLAFPGSLAIDEEAIFVEGRSDESSPSYFKISISKAKLSTPDIEGFKAWLKANPTTVYYELANPIYSEVSTDNFNLKTFNGATHVFSKHDFKPTISFSTDFVLLTSDAKQYCTADGNKSFILPDIASLQDSNALEIHLFVKMLANATLSFPSNILWNDLAKMNEVTKGSTAEFVFTYIKTAEGGSWLGTVVPHK